MPANRVLTRESASHGDTDAIAGAVVLELSDPGWADFTARCQEATPFHHPAWGLALARAYRYRAFAFALRTVAGELVAGAPFIEARTLAGRRRWISLPFTDECHLLASGVAGPVGLADALAAAQEGHGAPGIEVRGPMEAAGWDTSAHAVTHELELDPDVERVRARFSRSQVIRNIARAERAGTLVRVATCRADFDAFCALHERTRRRQGIPVQPRRFFDELWSGVVEPGLGEVLLADSAERPAVAGALFLSWNGTTIYKFGASDPDAWPQRPNHLIFWTAIRDACTRGNRRFDFGRTDLENAGLRAFKSTWGGNERPLVYSSLGPGRARGGEGVAGRALGAVVSRAPMWVGRGIGAALYRYAASR